MKKLIISSVVIFACIISSCKDSKRESGLIHLESAIVSNFHMGTDTFTVNIMNEFTGKYEATNAVHAYADFSQDGEVYADVELPGFFAGTQGGETYDIRLKREGGKYVWSGSRKLLD
jgi:hypothetical protein